MIKRFRRMHREFPEYRGLRHCIRVKRRILYHLAIAWPESHAAHFMRVSVSHERIRVRTLRRTPTGKTCNRQVEASPEKMHRAALTDKSRPKIPKNIADVYK